MKYFVEVHAAGSSERHELVAERTVVGSSSSADIRLDGAHTIAAQHVELVRTDTGVRARVLVDGALISFDGSEHMQATVPWGEEIYVAGIRLTFVRDARESSRPSPVFLVLAPALLLIGGLSAFYATSEGEASSRDVTPPRLFDEQTTCSRSEAGAAEHRARETENMARAKQQRFPFERTDGVEALALLAEAHACYTLARRSKDAERTRSELLRWKGHMNEEYAALRLRLRVALDQSQPDAALRSVLALEAMLVGQTGPYVDWLGALRRELERKVAHERS